MDINEEMYEYFIKTEYDPTGCNLVEEGGNDTYSPALYLKKHLSDQISEILTNALKHRTKYNEENQSENQNKKDKKKKKRMPAGGIMIPEREKVTVKDI